MKPGTFQMLMELEDQISDFTTTVSVEEGDSKQLRYLLDLLDAVKVEISSMSR